MNDAIISLTGALPAFILPTASLFQLIHLVKEKRSEGVNVISWVLFAVANVCLYIFTEKYTAWQSILGLLGTALINLSVAVMALIYQRKENTPSVSTKKSPEE